MARTTIKVLAVPESAHDEVGFVNAVPHEGRTDRYVGATIDPETTAKAGGKFRFAFESGPIEVPYTAYYRRAVVEGHLKAADEATAKLCGVPLEAPTKAGSKRLDPLLKSFGHDDKEAG